jgi:hypothetical protein
MTLTVREMMSSEVDVIIEYFQNSTPEHLETLGVDPGPLPTARNAIEPARPRQSLSRRCASAGRRDSPASISVTSSRPSGSGIGSSQPSRRCLISLVGPARDDLERVVGYPILFMRPNKNDIFGKKRRAVKKYCFQPSCLGECSHQDFFRREPGVASDFSDGIRRKEKSMI